RRTRHGAGFRLGVGDGLTARVGLRGLRVVQCEPYRDGVAAGVALDEGVESLAGRVDVAQRQADLLACLIAGDPRRLVRSGRVLGLDVVASVLHVSVGYAEVLRALHDLVDPCGDGRLRLGRGRTLRDGADGDDRQVR